MSVAFYMDEHVHRAITTALRVRGVDILTAQEDNYRHTADALLLDRATELGRVMFSQDEDLLIEAQRRQAEELSFAGIIYAHQMRVTIGQCVRDLELIAQAANPGDLANRVEYLPL